IQCASKEAGRNGFALLIARPAIELHAVAQLVAGVQERGVLVVLRLAVPRVEARKGELAWIELPVDERILAARIVPIAPGQLLLLVLTAHGEKARRPEAEA